MSDWKTRLTDGYKAFRAGDFISQKAIYEKLGTKGQKPEVMIIGCADSRVDPTDIFNAYPGEMFVARNVANIVPPYEQDEAHHGTSAAIEFAVTVLKVKVIVVMGHESCGGVAGCLSGMGDEPVDSFVGSWVSLLNTARDRVVARVSDEKKQQTELEFEGVRQSLGNLMTFPFIRDAVAKGDLSLQGAYFSIISAKLLMADETGRFSEVEV